MRNNILNYFIGFNFFQVYSVNYKYNVILAFNIILKQLNSFWKKASYTQVAADNEINLNIQVKS